MSNIVISIENLSKSYRLGQVGTGTLRYDLAMRWAKFLGQPNPMLKVDENDYRNLDGEMIWALRDVSFQVKQGEVLGVIGRNGAGKSTLLKILSRVTAPTSGVVKIKGRLASLLEVGTGFHPDLTGRENIFLNGAIQGMKKDEIRRKFDEIVNFSEVEQFIDTPVKRYSSGMYVRLAFAVAAHLEPEILLVDEVLAVGDSKFQKKCLGKMEAVAKEGRTVIFVSHNMEAVMRLCEKAVLLDEGKVEKIGPTDKVLNFYLLSSFGSISIRKWNDVTKAPGNDVARLLEVKVMNSKEEVGDNFDISEPVIISIEYEILKPGFVVSPAFNFHNDNGINIFDSHDNSDKWKGKPKPVGRYRSNVVLPGNFFSEGLIIVGAAAVTPDPFFIHFHERDVVAFNIGEKMNSNNARGEYSGNFPGIIRPLFPWHTEELT